MIKHLVSPALAALAALILPVSPAAAANNCIFKTIGTTLYLKNNCETDSTIVVPAGTYFTGGSFTISTVDPAGGYFVGPVVSLAGAGTVTALNIALSLGTACEANDTNRRIGLLLDGSSGTVTKTTIVVNRDAASTCSDGVGIEIRNDGSTPVRTTASIKTSSVSGAYWTGIRVRGNVNPRVDSNKVTGAAVTVALAQAGITLTEGAQGLIIKNTVLSNGRQSPKQVPGVGIVLDGVAIKTSLDSNTVQFNDIGIQVIGADTATVTKNKVTNSKREGISLVDGNGRVNRNNNVTSNTVEKNKDGISLTTVVTGAGATNNTIKSNTVTRSNQFGIVADGTLNKVQRNTVSDSVVTDIKNLGTKMSYQYNVCATRSGTPVDCGVTTP